MDVARELNAVLVVNAGSSSVKLRRIEGDDATAAVDLDAPAGLFDEDELAAAVEEMGVVDAVGHRIVHGGARFIAPVVIDDDVVAAIAALGDLAPLHQPHGVAAMSAVGRIRPEVPAVACFDTAFHATLPAAASTYALPALWRARWPLRRFGFHGLSHAWASRRVAELCGDPDGLRVVSCHLGAGASLAAVVDGRSVDTTMGFTPLAGLVMATRAGDVDPGLVLWLLRSGGLGAVEVAEGLERGAGLVGLAGTPDMREVLARTDADAALALEVYVHSLCGHVASMVAAMEGIDALVFTGGVGERAAPVRATAVAHLSWLGVDIDLAANAHAEPDVEITAAEGRVRTFVVRAREDLEIARGVRSALA